ncbi:MAG: ATP-binding protein [Nitrosopumilaceae archaeon]
MYVTKPKEEAEDLAKLATKAYYDLGLAKTEIEEKEQIIQELSNKASEKFQREIKINQDVQEKIQFLQELASTLSQKNENLELENKKLLEQQKEYAVLNSDLKKHLDDVVLKENDLEFQKEQLEKKISKQNEEISKSKKLTTLGEISSKLGDEMAVPLSMIKDSTKILESNSKLKNDDKRQVLRNLQRATRNMDLYLNSIRNMIAPSKLNISHNSLLSVIDSAIESVPMPYNVQVNVEQNDLIINCDFKLLSVCFSQILLNSIQEFEEEGKINIRIMDCGPEVMVAFEDTGKGIPDEILPKIFAPFFSTDLKRKGIGLAICKNIVEQHGGSITIKNSPTTVMVTIPQNH